MKTSTFISLKRNILIQIYFEYIYLYISFWKKKLMVGSNCVLNGKCLVSSSTFLYCTVHFFSLRNVHMRWTMFYFIHTVKEITMHLTPTYYRIWRVVGYRTVNQTIYTIIFNAYLIKWCVLSYSTGLLINLKDIVFYVGERIE